MCRFQGASTTTSACAPEPNNASRLELVSGKQRDPKKGKKEGANSEEDMVDPGAYFANLGMWINSKLRGYCPKCTELDFLLGEYYRQFPKAKKEATSKGIQTKAGNCVSLVLFTSICLSSFDKIVVKSISFKTNRGKSETKSYSANGSLSSQLGPPVERLE